jgi:hypothetical protein
MDTSKVLRPVENCILIIRGQKVLLDVDLAALYGVSVKRLNEQVLRNVERFPKDFRFQLNKTEHGLLRSQIATSKTGRGGRRYAQEGGTPPSRLLSTAPSWPLVC